MRVLVIAPVSSEAMHVGGGVAITYKVLTEKLKARGHEVEVLSSWNGSLEHAFFRPHPGFRMIKVSLKNMDIIREAIKRSDVVVCPDSALVACIGLECWRLGVPSIWVIHTNFMAIGKHVLNAFLFQFYDAASTFFLRSYGSAFTHILTTSHDYMCMLRKRGFRISGYIDQGFKADVFKEHDEPAAVAAVRERLIKGHPADTKVMLFAGRFAPEKRISLLFDCIPDGFVLALVGDGSLREEFMQRQAQDNRIVVVAEMLSQHDLRLYYKAADVTVSASDFETYGMTVHESLLCHTPVVVQDGNGFRSQVRHGVNGFLVNYEHAASAKRAIAQAVNYTFDARPFRAADCVDMVEFVETSAKKHVTPASKNMGWVISFLQYLYMIPTRISQIIFRDDNVTDW
ncbi:hypothetical protein PTSG_04936 [Salpingoeca rosetta]|uniref:Glycosyl transferase family 1 domain-containing protein n=1 Tax=Salpingoeca rosetta (strain ATCC 50818 / BSB-021) TaxID=946362 RepID=F2U918_SALR5|nr:uncharacterized protein PTSG_04936 [Salpingoeca rosetta]EGD73221.1 hypothetical protein PTSG_04936 [Salpingoeca rosetta]|eukprot:XP_004994252.1 hypothetical protein PTSG_04936 [Salpingoeca rosetta]